MKINVHEAAELLERELTSVSDAAAALHEIRDRAGGEGHAVAITLGAEGAMLLDPDGVTWRGRLDVSGRYPVGSGDTFFAGLLVGLVRGGGWTDALRVALAAAAANAELPGAARFDADRARELETRVDVQTFDG